MNRVDKLAARLEKDGLAALLVTGAANRRYLTGFTGSSGYVLVAGAKVYLLTDGRYVEQAQSECPGAEVVRHGPRWMDDLAGLVAPGALGFEAHHLTVAVHQALSEALRDVELKATFGLVEGLRQIKEPQEIAKIEKASQIADEALSRIVPEIRPGSDERSLALALEGEMMSLGAEGKSFDTIVASGPRSSLPHAQPTGRRIEEGDLVTVDWGATFEGYHSDCTRTFLVGEGSGRAKAIHAVVRQALEVGLEALRPGRSGAQVDEAARDHIRAAGFGDYFVHSLGHSVGLEIHEGPRLAPTAKDDILEEGMVLTVEPGIYLPGFGGVRIEQCAVVRHGAPQLLTHLPTQAQFV